MEEGERKAPVRVRLLFADRNLLSKAQRSEGLRRSWTVIRPEHTTVAEFCRDIRSRFGLSSTSRHGLLLSMDGFLIPPSESTSIFRDNDKIRVKGSIAKKKGKKAVPPPANAPQIEGTIVSNNGIPLIDNGEDATEKRKKKSKRPLPQEITSKREQKEVERPNCSKKKKLKLVANERPVIINESKKVVPAVAAPFHFHNVNQQTNAPVLISERNHQAASMSKNTSTISKHRSTGFYGGPNEKIVHGACPVNGTDQSLPSHWIPGQTRFMSPGAGPSNWQENGPRKPFQGDGTMTKMTSGKPRSGFNVPNVHNGDWQPWRNSSALNAKNSPLRRGNNFTTEEAAEKINPHREEINEDKLDFESLYPLPRLPMEGDIIAYCLDIIDSLGCPGLSSFRVGKVIVFDPVLMIIFLLPVPEYLTPDSEMSEFEKNMYKEDGSLEIDFESLVDLRLVKESQLKTAPKMHKSGKGKSKSKTSGSRDDAESSLSLLERNDNSVKSAWEVGEASNAKESTESGQGACTPSTSRAGPSGPSVGQYGSGFGLHDDFPRGGNDGRNGNSNSAWEANAEAANANQGTQAQQDGWDAWEPTTSRAGASWPRTGQHCSGFGSSCGYSRGGRRGRGGKYFNPRFN